MLDIGDKEISLIKLLGRFPATISEASETLSPALVANYCYDLAKEYNQFYHDMSILGEPNVNVRAFRLKLSGYTASVLKAGVGLLGMEMPEECIVGFLELRNMFESLTERLEKSFKILKGQGRITEINIAETLKDVRRALLDADVNYKIAKQFADTVKEKAGTGGTQSGQPVADDGQDCP